MPYNSNHGEMRYCLQSDFPVKPKAMERHV